MKTLFKVTLTIGLVSAIVATPFLYDNKPTPDAETVGQAKAIAEQCASLAPVSEMRGRVTVRDLQAKGHYTFNDYGETYFNSMRNYENLSADVLVDAFTNERCIAYFETLQETYL